MSSKKSLFEYRVEYLLVRLLAGLVNLMPYRLALLMAWCFARVVFHIVRFRRKETLRRLDAVFGASLTAGQKRRVAWISLRNIFFNAVEMMRPEMFTKKWVDAHMGDFGEKVAPVKEMIESKGGIVLAVPHMGNWDLAGWACCRYGIDMFSITGKQRNPYMNDWINRMREHGMKVLERGGGTMKQILRKLRSGGALAILPDVRVQEPDLSVPFLGGTANIGRGMAMFAIAAKVPIQPAVFRRVGWTRHRAVVFPPIIPNPNTPKEEEVLRITRKILEYVDGEIRKTPEQWFWYNRRWILFPVRPVKKDAP
jgi:KDO2-lipid IV(A) lauroyltransferase